MSHAFRSALATSVLFALAAAGAHAATIERQSYQNGGTACTGALPTYEGALRKRPLAIANEGGSTAFVTCSLLAEERSSSFPTLAYLRVQNVGDTALSVNCTMVAGAAWEGSMAYPKTISVSANSTVQVSWQPEAGQTFLTRRTVNFSCNLPPNGAIAYVGLRRLEEIGTP